MEGRGAGEGWLGVLGGGAYERQRDVDLVDGNIGGTWLAVSCCDGLFEPQNTVRVWLVGRSEGQP